MATRIDAAGAADDHARTRVTEQSATHISLARTNEETRRIFRKITVYFLIPVGIGGAMIAMYFSGNETLQSIIAPHSFNNMRPDSGREFGLLEHIQHLLVLVIAGASIWASRTKTHRLERTGFAILALFATLVFFEEIDYGLHYYEYAMGIEWKDSAEFRNLHNHGEVTDIIKQSVDVGIVVLFVFIAWGSGRSRRAWLRYLAPEKWFTLTLIGMVVMRFVAHGLGDYERELAGPLGKVGAISRGNLSEFREFFIYYIFMIYVITLAFFRDYRAVSKQIEAPSVADGTERL